MEKNKKYVYVAHPFRAGTTEGILKNIESACEYGRRLFKELGLIPIIPHTNSKGLFGLNGDNATVTDYDFYLLYLCDILAVCGERVSEGVQLEIDEASKYGIPMARVEAEGNLEQVKQIVLALDKPRRA